MNQSSSRILLDHWLWEPPMLKMFVTVAIVLSVLTCVIVLLTIGQLGFHALWFLGFAPLFGFGYGFVGKKIARIRDAIPAEEGVVIPGMMVKGIIESAGIVVMGEGSLFFHPLAGKHSATKLSDILSVREVSCFNGSVLWGKTGFWFSIPDNSRLGCAIPNSYAEQFRTWLSEGMKDGSHH